MNRREFLVTAGAASLRSTFPLGGWAQGEEAPIEHRLPPTDADYQRSKSYIEEVPVPHYHWASDRAVEAFRDMKFGLRIHWGIYSIYGRPNESWPFLTLPLETRQAYNQAYRSWNPQEFDADGWMNLCEEAGMKMFAFTSKHHEGFSMFDTKTRVRNRANWTAPGSPRIEDCDLAYSIMETPFRRDVVRELTDAAHRAQHQDRSLFLALRLVRRRLPPVRLASAAGSVLAEALGLAAFGRHDAGILGLHEETDVRRLVTVPDPTPSEVRRMVERHRAQLTELLTRYGTIDMMCLDIFWGPAVWPQMRETILKLRELQPDVMLRARGIGNYGDYYTPERFVPATKAATKMPWFVIYPLGTSFSYESDASKYKGAKWIIENLVDVTAKGGNFMVGVGPTAWAAFTPPPSPSLKRRDDG